MNIKGEVEETREFYERVIEMLGFSSEDRSAILDLVDAFLTKGTFSSGVSSEVVMSGFERVGKDVCKVITDECGLTLTPSVETSFAVLYAMRTVLFCQIVRGDDPASTDRFQEQAKPLDQAMLYVLQLLKV